MKQYYLYKELHLLHNLTWLACPVLNFHSDREKHNFPLELYFLQQTELIPHAKGEPDLRLMWIFPESEHFVKQQQICLTVWKATVSSFACHSHASQHLDWRKGHMMHNWGWQRGNQSLAIKLVPADKISISCRIPLAWSWKWQCRYCHFK